MCPDSGKGMPPIKNCIIIWIATGGYSGYLWQAPGTWGAAIGLLFFLVLRRYPLPIYSMVLVGLIVLGIWAAGIAERLLCCKDASAIVIDEIAGMLLTYYAIPADPWMILLGFGLFRLFDIYKTLPQLESLPGGWGIMSDDLWAACLAQSCLHLYMWYF